MFTFGIPANRSDSYLDHGVWVILYQTNMSLAPLGGFFYSQLAEQMEGFMQPEVIGMGTTFGGFSAKHHLALNRLRAINPNDLVILSDYADVVLNPGYADRGVALLRFVEEYRDLTRQAKPGAVVVSAEAQCCVGALSYVTPGDLVDANGSRRKRACNSGASDCLGKDQPGRPWEKFMEALAFERNSTLPEYPYLNAGMVAGRARDVARLLADMDLNAEEDDQAVMTDMLHKDPERFVLDYRQQLFGNARWPLHDKGCVFRYDTERGQFQQRDTGTYPLFMHTSGHFYRCLRSLAYRVGWTPPDGRVPADLSGIPSRGAALWALLAAAALLFR